MQQPPRRRSTQPPVENLIRDLREQIETGAHLPASRVFVDEDLFLRTLDELRVSYTQAVQEARWVVEQRHELLAEAEAEAAQLVATAQRSVQAMLTDVGLKAAAEERAEEITQAATAEAEGTRESAWAYALDELTTLSRSLQAVAGALNEARRHLPSAERAHRPVPPPAPVPQEPEKPAWRRPVRRWRRPER